MARVRPRSTLAPESYARDMHTATQHATTSPRALVIRTAGTNCDEEMLRAFVLAGARATSVHVDTLIAEPQRLADADLIGLPGGFSYGDDIASGRILAVKLREELGEAMRAAVARGSHVIGVCNGFQVMVQAGLLPDPVSGTRSSSLVLNASARFIDEWVPMEVDPASPCVWTAGLAEDGEQTGKVPGAFMLPIAHGEGRFIASPDVLAWVQEHHLVPLRYGRDINGSVDRIAGLTDMTGRVFGLMPHPERFLDWTRHPSWTRLDRASMPSETPGLSLFRNAVRAAAVTPPVETG